MLLNPRGGSSFFAIDSSSNVSFRQGIQTTSGHCRRKSRVSAKEPGMNQHTSSGPVSLLIRSLLVTGFLFPLATAALHAANLYPDPAFPVGLSPAAVAAADFNGDGKSDLATANSLSNDLSILLGRGNGEFEPERRIAIEQLYDHPTNVAAADLNADGKIDLAVTYSPNALLIFL